LPKAPVKAWVDAILADFTALRGYLQKCDTHWGKARKFSYALPALKERAAWHTFMVGAAEAEGNVGQYFATSDDSDSDSFESMAKMTSGKQRKESDDDTTACGENMRETQDSNSWRLHLPSAGYAPDTTLLLQMDQVMIRQLLTHLAHYSREGWHMTRQRGAWCYALLARLETPIHREQAVVFYNWLKALTAQRAKQDQDTKNQVRRTTIAHCLASLNTVIAILGIFFEQGGGLEATMQVPT
jgi:survival of motor neuron protein-interacting protein 1